jgi:hypothetical protein
MIITQTIDVPANHRITLDIPPQVPTGRTIIAFTPAKEQNSAQNRKPISQFFGILSPDTYGDGVAYQRKIRDEWDG